VIALVTPETPTGFHWADFAAGSVEVYAELLEGASTSTERAMLERRTRRGCRALRPVARRFHGIRARRWLLIGRLRWERGRRRRALRAWRKAESIAGALGSDYELACARLEIARHDLAGPGRDALIAGAIETFEQLGATRQLRIAETL
jgi:hypothetical protein